MLRFLTVVALVFGTTGSYLGWRFIGPLEVSLTVRVLLWLALAGMVLIIPVGFLARFSDLTNKQRDMAAWVGFVLMGFFFLLLTFSLGREIVLAGVKLANEAYLLTAGTRAMLPPDDSLVRLSNAVILGGAALLALYGMYAARHRLTVEHVDLTIPDLHPDLDGFLIAQISDMHIGPTIKSGFLKEVVDRVNSLEPDCIALTGDAVDGSVDELREHTALFGQLQARYGVFYCTGNHEYYSGVHAWVDEFRRLGLRVLLNEHELVEHKNGRLLMAGVTDYSGGHFDPRHRSDPVQAVAGAPGSHFKVLLAHQPRSAGDASRAGFDLQLSGHTHGGQIWPFHHLIRFQQPFRAGLHFVDGLRVYVNRGTGYWGPPLRVGSTPEITLIRLRGRPDDDA